MIANSSSIPDPNLVTCGQWSFLMNSWEPVDSAGSATYLANALGPFASLSLDALSENAAADAMVYADLISTCLLDIYKSVKFFLHLPMMGQWRPHVQPANFSTVLVQMALPVLWLLQ